MAKLINYIQIASDLRDNAAEISAAQGNPEALAEAYKAKIRILAPKQNEIAHDLLTLTGSTYILNDKGVFVVQKHTFAPWCEREEERKVIVKRSVSAKDIADDKEKLDAAHIQGDLVPLEEGGTEFVIDPAQEGFFINLKTALGRVESTKKGAHR